MRNIYILLSVLALLTFCQIGGCISAEPATIVYPAQSSVQEVLAAKEVRRYIYQRTGQLLDLQAVELLPQKGNLIVVASKGRALIAGLEAELSTEQLAPQQYTLKTIKDKGRKNVVIAGGDSAGTLYGAYKFAEHLGVRFFMHGDTIPDKKIAFKIADLDETQKPLFEMRGIQPFHDFPEGPDWWNTNDYKAIFAQLPKLGMNFFALHTYPQGWAGPEPGVWIGTADQVKPDGQVKSSYPSRHMTTNSDQWGYEVKNTGDYLFGASQIFERNDYGPDYMVGVNPWKEASEQTQNKLFNDVGQMFNDTFTFARALGIKTCIGTETPLTVPDDVKKRLEEAGKDPEDAAVITELYEGMFERIKRTHPLDYYWLWTPENWTWSGATPESIDKTEADLLAAVKAIETTDAPFTLATCGWMLGPPGDRGRFDRLLPKNVSMSCINRYIGIAPVDKDFNDITGRDKWAIPWLEDDGALTVPQLWVGRMRRDAADSLSFGCDALIGIHWRTRILGPNVSALAKAGWNQKEWYPDFGKKINTDEFTPPDYYVGAMGTSTIDRPIEGAEDQAVYQSCRFNMDSYHLTVPNGSYKVRLRFAEYNYDKPGERVFGIKIQGVQLAEGIDIFARVGKDKALDLVYDDIKVDDNMFVVEFTKEKGRGLICAIEIEGQTDNSEPFTRKMNCGALAYKDYEADIEHLDFDGRLRHLASEDFYADWAIAQFGTEAAEPIAKLFTSLDGGGELIIYTYRNTNMPRPSTWVQGPGGLLVEEQACESCVKNYGFVDEMELLRPRVKGAGSLERFDYWLNQFRFTRAMDKLGCTVHKFNTAMKDLEAQEDESVQKQLAKETALPLRKDVNRGLAEVYKYLLSSITTPGGMGNVANFALHAMPKALDKNDEKLAEILGDEFSLADVSDKTYRGAPRVFVPTVRTSLVKGEDLKLKVILLGANPASANIFYRTLGKGSFASKPIKNVNRGVYTVTLYKTEITEDFEYYVKIVTGAGRELKFPPTAPNLNQSVVIMPEK